MHKARFRPFINLAALSVVLALASVPIRAQPPVPDAIVEAVEGAPLRGGPGAHYPEITTAHWGAFLGIDGRSADRAWVNVRYRDLRGWAEVRLLRLNIDLESVPILQASPAPEAAPTVPAVPIMPAWPCVSVVGDSIAEGWAVFEMPGVGYLSVPTAPVSAVLAERLSVRGNTGLKVIDRSVGAVGISAPNHPRYFDHPAYQALLQDRCKFVLVMPWVNDLSSEAGPGVAAPAHIAALAQLVDALVAANPVGRILIYNYYIGQPAGWAQRGFASGFTAETIAMFNQQLEAACSGGVLSLPQVTCLDINQPLTAVSGSYVFGKQTRAEMEAQLMAALKPEEIKMLDYYQAIHPGALLDGDGVHLNLHGKTAVADHAIAVMETLPNLRPPGQ